MKITFLFFVFIWSNSLQAAVSCLYSIANLVRQDQGWFQVVLPTERGFEFQEVNNQFQALELISSVSEFQRIKIEDSLNEVADHYQSIINQLKVIAVTNHLQLQFRLKDPESIRSKIIDRARSFSRQGRIFQINDLHDLAGGRLIVGIDSPFYTMSQNKKIWAQLLGIPQDRILEIEIKGNSEDQSKGKYYRAVHLVILHESGVRFELQVLSKAVKRWHKWNHSHVYKTTNVDQQYQMRLNQYSDVWIQTIRLLEDFKLNPNSEKLRNRIREMQAEMNIDFTWMNWPLILDSYLANLYEISYHDRLLVESNKNKELGIPTVDRKAIKDLGLLTIR